MKSVAILGLGYVGLPLACLLAKKEYIVYGIEPNQEKVDLINQGISPIDDEMLKKDVTDVKDKIIASSSFENIAKSEFVIICVPTPVDEKHNPDFSMVESASEEIVKYLKEGQLVILESTVSPGTCEDVILPILERTGLKGGKEFYLAHCPERIDPGNKIYTLNNLPRVVGALSKEGLKKAAEFYRSFIDVNVVEVSSIKAAEATKIIENAFRDINIAFVNELARCFDRIGVDVTEVIKGAATKPFAFMPHYPGCGVGGHCISVDPYYLIEKAKGFGFDHKFLSLAREINNSMPAYTISKMVNGLNELGKSVKGTKITVFGLAYKPNVDDIRESPALEIISDLKKMGADLKVYDPWLLNKSTVKELDQALDCEVFVLCTAHDKFTKMDLNLLKEKGVKLVIDGRNCLDKEKIEELGIMYKGIGR